MEDDSGQDEKVLALPAADVTQLLQLSMPMWRNLAELSVTNIKGYAASEIVEIQVQGCAFSRYLRTLRHKRAPRR